MRSASEKRNFELVDKVFGPIDDKASSIGVQALSLDEKVVYFIWAALGLIENGSFQYFFENQMDPDATAKAYDQLGLPAGQSASGWPKVFYQMSIVGWIGIASCRSYKRKKPLLTY